MTASITTYGTLTLDWLGTEYVASLTSQGWHVVPASVDLADALNYYTDSKLFGPDAMAGLIRLAARIFSGQSKLTPTPKPPIGVITSH